MKDVVRVRMGRDPAAPPHKFLRRIPPEDRPIVREISIGILNTYRTSGTYSRKELRGVTLQIPWFEEQKDAAGVPYRVDKLSRPFTLHDLEQSLRNYSEYRFEDFELYDPGCPWLDDQLIIANELQFSDDDGSGRALAFELPTKLGGRFPIVPRLDREGWGASSFQRAVAIHIRRLWNRLVDNSDQFDSYDWLLDLRACVSECVSLIDITLHQLYWKALYDPLPGWSFHPGKVGSPYARRMSDKLKWVTQITGKQVHAREQLRGFASLRGLRNHLQHFDPPCFACHLDEAAAWLNHVQDVAVLAMKMRQAMASPLSPELIALLLLPRVELVPLPSPRPRLPTSTPAGYAALLASAPTPPPDTPTSKASAADIDEMLLHVEAIRGGKTDAHRQKLTSMILRLMADIDPDRAADEARKRGLE